MAKVEVVCEFCGKVFLKHECMIKKTKHNFCSPSCHSEYRRDKKEVACDFCGKTVLKTESCIKRVKHNFCSPPCHHEFLRGKPRSKEVKDKVSRTKKEYFKTHPSTFLGKHHNRETKEILSKARMGKPRLEATKRKISKTNKEKQISKKLWQDPEYIQKVMDGLNAQPNKQELQIYALIQIVRPNEFKYNGGFELGISIGGKIPDWVNCNGKKQVIEFFGAYWHSPLVNPKVKHKQTYKETIKHYKKYGWKCLIIWDNELRNPDKIIEKIKNF